MLIRSTDAAPEPELIVRACLYLSIIACGLALRGFGRSLGIRCRAPV
jgi:hypothetical protein